MTLNEILLKQSVLAPLLVKSGDDELSKELKVKIVRLRIAFNKIKNQFEDEIKEFSSSLIPEDLKKLQEIPEDKRTPEDSKKIEELVNKVNSEYREFLEQKGKEEVTFTADDSFTDNEFDEIISVNAGNDVTVNSNNVKAEELMDSFYALFVDKK